MSGLRSLIISLSYDEELLIRCVPSLAIDLAAIHRDLIRLPEQRTNDRCAIVAKTVIQNSLCLLNRCQEFLTTTEKSEVRGQKSEVRDRKSVPDGIEDCGLQIAIG